MTTSESASVGEFSAAERTYIRRELGRFFTTLPSVGEGVQLRTWRTGPRKGEPKRPPAAQSLVERRLMRLDATSIRRASFSRRRG